MEHIFFTFLFIQATLTLIIKLYKRILIKYNPKQNITIFSSIAHVSFDILTAQMVNDLNETLHNKPKTALKDSKFSTMTHLTDNPPDDFSHSENQTNQINNTTGITSPPPFHTKKTN